MALTIEVAGADAPPPPLSGRTVRARSSPRRRAAGSMDARRRARGRRARESAPRSRASSVSSSRTGASGGSSSPRRRRHPRRRRRPRRRRQSQTPCHPRAASPPERRRLRRRTSRSNLARIPRAVQVGRHDGPVPLRLLRFRSGRLRQRVITPAARSTRTAAFVHEQHHSPSPWTTRTSHPSTAPSVFFGVLDLPPPRQGMRRRAPRSSIITAVRYAAVDHVGILVEAPRAVDRPDRRSRDRRPRQRVRARPRSSTIGATRCDRSSIVGVWTPRSRRTREDAPSERLAQTVLSVGRCRRGVEGAEDLPRGRTARGTMRGVEQVRGADIPWGRLYRVDVRTRGDEVQLGRRGRTLRRSFAE